MKHFLAFAAAALIATPAVAAPVLTFAANPAPYAVQPVDMSFTTTRPGIIDGMISEFKALSPGPRSTAYVTGPGGQLMYAYTYLSKPMSTLALAPIHIAAGTYALHYQDRTSDGYSGSLNFTSTPEPAAWALMILGFGAVGFAMRRREQLGRVSYA